jgi:hypothetical protein
MCSFVGTRAATAGAVGVDRHVVWLEGRRGTFHNACLGGSKLLLQWWFKRVCGSTFLRFAVLGRRSIWAVLRLVAAWQFGTGVLWASVACFVNCTLIRQHPCPRVACYCAFAAQSGGGWWLAGEGARSPSVRGTRTLFRDRAGRGSNRCPGFSPWTDASDVFASVAPSRLRIAWECQRDSRPLVFVVALARCFRFAPACFCLLS